MAVLCTGAAVVDVLVESPEALPPPGGSTISSGIVLAPGGCGVNTAIGLARLGVPVRFAARLGTDGAGDFLKTQLAAAGVQLEDYIQCAEIQTKGVVVFVAPDGERSFVRTRGGGNALKLADLQSLDWDGVTHLHIGGCYSLRQLLREDLAAALRLARSRSVVTCLDTVWASEGNWHDLLPALPHIDHLLPSLEEARQLTGERSPEAIACWLRLRGAKTVVVKLGDGGAYFENPATSGYVAALAVPGGRVVDTTGAGDAFCAGYVAGLAERRSVAEATLWGNAWAAVAISGIGATTALRERSQLEAILAIPGSWVEEREDG